MAITLSSYSGVADVMTTELNTLGATTGKAIASTAVDNSAALSIWADFHLLVTFAVAPTLNAIVELYLLRSLDAGSTYADGSSSVLSPPTAYVGGFPVRAVTTAQVIPLYGIPLPPGLFKPLVQNTTAQAFPASGSILKMNAYAMQVT